MSKRAGRTRACRGHALPSHQVSGQVSAQWHSPQVPGTRKVLRQVFMSLPSGVTGHLGTPMKETGGLSQPPRSLNHPPVARQGRGPHATARVIKEGTHIPIRHAA